LTFEQRLMFHKFYARTSIRRIIAFALLRRAYFAFSTTMNGISNDQDVMDYALNKASEELLKNSLHFETKILFIITSLTVSIGMI
jgi:hypothetical protein